MTKPKDARPKRGRQSHKNGRMCAETRKDGKPCNAAPRRDGPLCRAHQNALDTAKAKAEEMERRTQPIRVVPIREKLRDTAEAADLTDEECVLEVKRLCLGIMDGSHLETIQTSRGDIIEKECGTKDKLYAASLLFRMCGEESIEDEIDMMTAEERRIHLVGLLG